MDNKNHKGMFLELNYGKDIKLDLKDKKILSILGDNCRTSIANIGKTIQSSKDSVRYRIKQLIQKDVYRGNITIINPFVLGFPVYTILLKIKSITPEKENKIIDFFANHPFIIWIGKTQGTYDFNIVIIAKNPPHFDRLLKEIQKKLQNNIKDLKTLHLTKMFAYNTFPPELKREFESSIKNYSYKKIDSSFSKLIKGHPVHIQEERKTPNLKEILILKEIANNANLSLQQISEKTKIKPDTVKNILKGLINKNIILAFRGLINVSFLRFHGYVVYFQLSPDIKEIQRTEFENFFKKSPNIAFGTGASGSHYDLIVYLFSKNPLEFNELINEVRNKFSNIIEDYNADLILKDYKFTFFPKGLLGVMKSILIKLGLKFKKI